MRSEFIFKNSLGKLGNLIAKLDSKLGLSSEFGKKYSTLVPDFNPLKIAEKATATASNPSPPIATSAAPTANPPQETKEQAQAKPKKEKPEQSSQPQPQESQKPKEKKEKKPHAEKEPQPGKEKPSKDQKSPVKEKSKIIENFNDIEFKVAKVEKIIPMEGSEKLFHCWVDAGEGSLREIGCGLREHGVPAEEFTKLQIVIFANLKAKKLASIMSNGMILSASKNHNEFELVRPPATSKPGDIAFLEGQEPRVKNAEQLSANKFTKALTLLKTTEDLHASYGGIKIKTTEGYLSVHSFANSPIS